MCRLESASQADCPHGAVELVSAGSPGSISIGRSPISSPQPSFSSSHKSVRSSGRGSGRKKRRNHSPGHTSSGSEDTVRVSKHQDVCMVKALPLAPSLLGGETYGGSKKSSFTEVWYLPLFGGHGTGTNVLTEVPFIWFHLALSLSLLTTPFAPPPPPPPPS
jgi:hypothetical protein